MPTLSRLAATGFTAVAVLAASVACDKHPDTESPSSSTTSPASTAPVQTSTPVTTSPAVTAPSAGSLAAYAKANNLTLTELRHGDPGPKVDLPVSQGWKLVYDEPDAPFGALVLQKPTDPKIPGRIVMLMTKLGGKIDRDAIFAASNAEIIALPDFHGPQSPQTDTLAGFVTSQIGGLYQPDQQLIAQKTVVIPTDGGAYVLRLRASGNQEDAAAMMLATSEIDKKATITA